MTFLRLDHENKSAFSYRGTCERPWGYKLDLYDLHTLIQLWFCYIQILYVWEKHPDKTICSHNTVSCYKGKGHVQCHGNFIIAPSWWNSLFRQQPWYSSLHKKSIKCVYLSFPSGNSENTEQFSLGETAVNVFPPKWLQQHCDLLSHVITNKTSAISNPEGPQTDA